MGASESGDNARDHETIPIGSFLRPVALRDDGRVRRPADDNAGPIV